VSDQSASPATAWLLAWNAGDESGLDRLIPVVHDELRKMARRLMARERPEHTLQPTALVNEAFLRLIDLKQIQWQNRAHFLAMAARIMRRVLVDAARAKGYGKRGGAARTVVLDVDRIATPDTGLDVVRLHEALDALTKIEPRKSQVVEMRFFGGLSVEETAEVLGVSRDTVLRDWKFARVWLARELKS
jgi:RNA polymerase sigma-70 factor (ECF subfamily)